ncbi:hypothetical protein LIT25_27865 (plasmid) [Bacillus sp. F19]|nr:hypothetical protein LIT25_27865 [Bacillus sp. F19]
MSKKMEILQEENKMFKKKREEEEFEYSNKRYQSFKEELNNYLVYQLLLYLIVMDFFGYLVTIKR